MKVRVFTTTTCPFCRMEKEYLDSKGVKYENIYVDEDQKEAEELMALSGQFGVPFTVIIKDDGSTESVLGFNKETLNEILQIK